MTLTETLLRSRIRRILNEIHPDPGGGYSGSGESTHRQPMIIAHRDATKLINFVDHNPGAIGGDLEQSISSSKHDPMPLLRMIRFVAGEKLQGHDDEYWGEVISKDTGGRYTKPEKDPYVLRGGR